jgi:hypothetical protein
MKANPNLGNNMKLELVQKKSQHILLVLQRLHSSKYMSEFYWCGLKRFKGFYWSGLKRFRIKHIYWATRFRNTKIHYVSSPNRPTPTYMVNKNLTEA